MAQWLVKAEFRVEAPTREEAWLKASEVLEPLNGGILSIPQQPEPAETEVAP